MTWEQRVKMQGGDAVEQLELNDADEAREITLTFFTDNPDAVSYETRSLVNGGWYMCVKNKKKQNIFSLKTIKS